MRRTFLWSTVAFLTFIAGVISASLWAFQDRVQSIPAINLPDAKQSDAYFVETGLPLISLCELTQNPERYSSEMVRVRSILVTDKERFITYLFDEDCEGKPVWLAVWRDEYARPNDCLRFKAALDQLPGSKTPRTAIVVDAEVVGQFIPVGEYPYGDRLFIRELRGAQLLQMKISPPPRIRKKHSC